MQTLTTSTAPRATDVTADRAPVSGIRRIAAGAFDGYIRKWANVAAAYGGPIVLRLAHEHNGRWFSWGDRRFDNTPALFIKAWRRIWTIFKGRKTAPGLVARKVNADCPRRSGMDA